MKLDELEKLAKAATPGPWWTYHGSGVFSKGQEGLSLSAECCGENADTRTVNLDYIAAANPDTVLGLIDHIRKLESERAKLIAVARAAKALSSSVDEAENLPEHTFLNMSIWLMNLNQTLTALEEDDA